MDRLAQQLFICFLALAAILVLEYYTDIDLWIQDLLYVSESRQWVVNPLLHQKLTWFFYKGPKFFYGAVCFSAVVYLLLSRRVKSLRRHNDAKIRSRDRRLAFLLRLKRHEIKTNHAAGKMNLPDTVCENLLFPVHSERLSVS